MKRDVFLPLVVQTPQFPCRRVFLGKPVSNSRDIVNKWLECRINENWVLVSGSAFAGETHAWVALTVLKRNIERDKMKSNSLDGEFIRLLSGTHHISLGFTRAGIVEGDEYAWIVDLSEGDEQSDYTMLAEKMGFELISDRPSLDLFDATRLGIDSGASEDIAIGHIHLADLN